MLLIGKPSISMGNGFHGYVKPPEGNVFANLFSSQILAIKIDAAECPQPVRSPS
jgi:hypothetical protein